MNTKDKGNLGELIVVSECIKRGYVASLPFGDNARYDLVIDTKTELLKVQVKFTTPKNGVITQPLYTIRRNTPTPDNPTTVKHSNYTASEIDAIIVVNANTNETYLLKMSEFSEIATVTLRLDPVKCSNPNVRWASDYRW
jgi:hypothetical protein